MTNVCTRSLRLQILVVSSRPRTRHVGPVRGIITRQLDKSGCPVLYFLMHHPLFKKLVLPSTGIIQVKALENVLSSWRHFSFMSGFTQSCKCNSSPFDCLHCLLSLVFKHYFYRWQHGYHISGITSVHINICNTQTEISTQHKPQHASSVMHVNMKTRRGFKNQHLILVLVLSSVCECLSLDILSLWPSSTR